MANGASSEDLDEWLRKLDNLQKALKSCTAVQPRRFQSPQLAANNTTPQPHITSAPTPSYSTYSRNSQNSTFLPHGEPPRRPKPDPPVRQVFANVHHQHQQLPQQQHQQQQQQPLQQRRFIPPVPQVHHYFPGEPIQMAEKNGNGYQKGHVAHDNQSPTPKSKSVRWWGGDSGSDRLDEMRKLVNDLEIVEKDLMNATSHHSHTNGHQRSLSPEIPDIPEIPPPPAFVNSYDPPLHENSTVSEDAINGVDPPDFDSPNLRYPQQQHRQQALRFSPPPVYRELRLGDGGGSSTPAADRDSLQSQESYSTLVRGRTVAGGHNAQPSGQDWVGNLNFWKSLQNIEGSDAEGSGAATQREEEQKVVLRVHHPDRTTKALYIHPRTDAGETVLMLASKNFLPLSTKMSLVEKVPSMKLERCFEDDETIWDSILSWPVNSENLIFFEERQDVFGIFEDPQTWLGNTLGGDTTQMANSLLMDILEKDGVNRLPPFKDYLYILQPSNKWKRRYCVLRSSGLYASKKQGSDISNLVRVTAFGEHLHLYTTSGGWSKDNTPTPYGFVLKPHSVATMDARMARAFCAVSEESLRIWCSLIRIIMLGPRLLHNYRQRLAACAINCQMSPGLFERTSANAPHRQSSTASLLELVRSKYARENTAYVRQSARQFSKLPAIARARSVSQIKQQIASRQSASLSVSQVSLKPAESAVDLRASTSDLGFVSGRTDVGRTLSLGELCSDGNQSDGTSTQSLNVSQRIGSLFNPLRWSRHDVKTAPRIQQKQGTTRGGKGPAARKCNRSGANMNRPQSISPASSVFFVPPPSNAQIPVEPTDFHSPILGSPARQHQQRLIMPLQSPRLERHCQRAATAILPSRVTPAGF